ncbi:MAG: ActS/PrrB/RegB family redox-sensitive histidine kinase [Paracoccaceae bacterium]
MGNTDSNRVRLRTLVLLRWAAILGQIVAITVASAYLGVTLPLGACYVVVGTLAIANLSASFIFPQNRRLTEQEALLTLLFDMTQLAALIYLTGGLTNPFALLILAPVTISASALRLQTTLILGAVAIAYVTTVTFLHVPMRLANGAELTIPALFRVGFWLSIVVGILFLGFYARRVATEIRAMAEALLATQMALAREQKLTDLGGVVAAAAHELGTPLATIKLASAELMDELADQPDLLSDAQLIRDQADRCRDILRGMGRAGKDDLQLRQAPLESVLREAAEPHAARGKVLHFDMRAAADCADRQPIILRLPEVVHGLRNLIQNAVDFAANAVWIEAEWTHKQITITITDNGSGYPPNVIGRIGDPFVRSRRPEQEMGQRPEYEGMGLGLFIAKTLLERSGAQLTFANATDPFLRPEERPDRCGAVVQAVWPIDALAAPPGLTGAPNRSFLP